MEEHEERLDELNHDENEESKEKFAPPTFLQGFRRLFITFPSEKRAEQYQRLRDLTEAIEQYPETAVNYLLRGELHFEMKQYDLAREDLEKSLQLAQEKFENERWGLTAQSTMDRAKHKLQRIKEYL